jgi:hypothetical protein
MRNVFKRLAGSVPLHILNSGAQPAYGITTAQKRAARGMGASLVAACILCGLALLFAPGTNAVSAVVALVQAKAVFGLACSALAASLCGLYFTVRYVLVSRQPN